MRRSDMGIAAAMAHICWKGIFHSFLSPWDSIRYTQADYLKLLEALQKRLIEARALWLLG